jgi:hypothetical protein
VHWDWRWEFRTITMKCKLFINYLCFVSFKQSINTNNKSFIVLSPHPLTIGHMFIWTFLLRIIDTTTSNNIYYSSWNTLYCSSIL